MDKETHSKCSKCKEVKLKSHFTRDKSKPNGVRYMCRGCQREHRKKHSDRYAESRKRYAKKPESRYKKYKRSAEERGFKWLLTRDQFMKHWQKPCVHCGSPIETIGLDRIDSSKPYEDGNVEPCCPKCNQMKSDWTSIDWYLHMEKIRKNQRGFISAIRRLWK